MNSRELHFYRNNLSLMQFINSQLIIPCGILLIVLYKDNYVHYKLVFILHIVVISI